MQDSKKKLDKAIIIFIILPPTSGRVAGFCPSSSNSDFKANDNNLRGRGE
jgi:hypothetical protein